jgi:hypothetical protein
VLEWQVVEGLGNGRAIAGRPGALPIPPLRYDKCSPTARK